MQGFWSALRASAGWQAATINAIWFGPSFLWNAVHPILLPTLLLHRAPATKNTFYGLLTFVGLLVAMVVQPLSGAISDHTAHRLGRRRPWIIVGGVLGLACLALMVGSRTLAGLALGYGMLQFASNILHGPAQGLIPDLVPVSRHGLAAGAKSFVDMMGVIAAGLIISRVLDGQPPRAIAAASVIAGVWTAAILVTVLVVKEKDTADRQSQRLSIQTHLRGMLGIRLRGLGDYARLLASRYCILLSTYTVQSFALFYFADVLRLPSPTRAMGNMMTMIGLSVLLSALPAGVLSERYGRKRLSLVAIGIVLAGMTALGVVRGLEQVWPLGIVIGLGMGVFSSVNWAWATDLVPVDEPAKYLGLSNLATAGAAATSRLVGPLIDLCNNRWPNAGYSLLFVIAVLGAGVALVITSRMRETRRDGPGHASREFTVQQQEL
jgi:MFS family permease